jgi:hypothetical protein
MNGGDQLARGAKSAAFPASEGNISQEKWDSIFGDWEPETPALRPLDANAGPFERALRKPF